MRVNCNISAIVANNQLTKSQNSLDKSIQRLSSGLKINTAEDDAAGMAIAKKLHTQIKGLSQASNNGSDGISVVETAESALSETENILQRVNELAIQAASETNSLSDRKAIQSEIDSLLSEVDRISAATEFNTTPLLDGSLNRRCYANIDEAEMFSVSGGVASGEYTLEITQGATQATVELNFDISVINTLTESFKVKICDSDIVVDPSDTEDTFKAKILEACECNSLVYDNGTITSTEYGSMAAISVDIPQELKDNGAFTYNEIQPRGTDLTAKLGAGFSNSASVICEGNFITITDLGDFEMIIEIDSASNVIKNATDADPVEFTEKVTDIGNFQVQIGANEGQTLNIDIPDVSCHSLRLDNANVLTTKGADDLISKVDYAINRVSSIRSKLGAYQNRLESSVTHLAAYEENITAAVSRVEDVDMAEEMTEYTQQNIITQAATSMIAQANEKPQSVLQLLQG